MHSIFDVFTTIRKDELDSSNIKTKESKVEFLTKVFNVIKKNLGDDTLDFKPSKIVAGVEAEHSRRFLQLLVLSATIKKESMIQVESSSHIISKPNKQRDSYERAKEESSKGSENKYHEEDKIPEHKFRLNTEFKENHYYMQSVHETIGECQNLENVGSRIQELASTLLPIRAFLDNFPKYLSDLNKISQRNEEEYKRTEMNYFNIKVKFDQDKAALVDELRSVEDEINAVNLEIVDIGKNNYAIQKTMQRFRDYEMP